MPLWRARCSTAAASISTTSAPSSRRRRFSSADEATRWLWLASAAAAALWDDERWYVLSARHLKTAREAGALTRGALAGNADLAHARLPGRGLERGDLGGQRTPIVVQ